jgi:hypothetical protein
MALLVLLMLFVCREPAASRGVVILPGLANNAADYAGLSDHLRSRGLATSIVQVGHAELAGGRLLQL